LLEPPSDPGSNENGLSRETDIATRRKVMYAELILQRLDMWSACSRRRMQALATKPRFVPIAVPGVYRPVH
jgi:hypothetical protein